MERSDLIAIAKAAHEAVGAFAHNVPKWNQLSKDERAALETLAMTAVDPYPGARGAHSEWANHLDAYGWTHANKRDPEAKTHPGLRSWGGLSLVQRVAFFVMAEAAHDQALAGKVRARATLPEGVVGHDVKVTPDPDTNASPPKKGILGRKKTTKVK